MSLTPIKPTIPTVPTQPIIEAKVPGGLGFIFDVIIVRIDLPKIPKIVTSKISVDVKFNKSDIKITSSRINVYEFKSGRSYEFTENPSVLKDQLYKNPLACTVSYDGKPVGNCDFIWPEAFLKCITDCAGELTRCDEANIKSGNEIVGQLEIIVRLQVKCHEFDEKQANQPKTNFCDLNDKVIDPNDILFVVGEDRHNKGACDCPDVGIIPATDSEQSINPTSLDLSHFRRVNGKTVATTEILNSIDGECCKHMKSSKYQQMIDSLLGNGKNNTPSCSKQQQSPSACERQTKPVDCVSGTRFASCSSTESCNPCRFKSDESNENMMCQKNGNSEKPTKRCCPLCRENISWLPQFTACPKCGFKSINYSEEKPYNDTLTADTILKEFLAKNIRDVGGQQCEPAAEKTPCRCTCSKGKICAFCRIRILCADIFQPADKGKQNCGKCELKSSDMYNVCKTSSEECRPYLATVFQELKDIYNIKESVNKDNESDSAKQCEIDSGPGEKQTQKNTKNNRLSRIQDKTAIERKNYLEKNFRKQDACKGKSFDYSTVRTYPGVQIGHKTCLNGGKNVPCNMGWLWSADATGIRTGWKPGAIRKSIKVLMNHFLVNTTGDVAEKKQKKKQLCCGAKYIEEESEKDDDKEDDYTKKPALHICKKNGVYYVTLRPLKDAETLKDCTDPFVDMKPIQFKITKNPILLELRNLKQCLKAMGFPKCTCHKPISQCCCRTFLDKKKLEYQCHKECRRRNLESCTDSLVLSDTSDSDAEFDFGVTPPAGVPHPHRCLKKRRKVSTGTQYENNDWNITVEYPQKMSKYEKLYNCAVGERFGKAFGPYGSGGYTAGAAPAEGIFGPCGFIRGAGGAGGVGGVGGVGGGKGGPGGKGVAVTGPQAFLGPDGKFSMAKYLEAKAFNKPSPAELAEKKKQRLALLKGGNPPLLCMVDRRGKPFDYCAACPPMPCCDTACFRDNRIC